VIRRAWYLAHMLRNERLALHRLLLRQDALLRDLVRHAAEQVPLYRSLYAGIDTLSIRGAADLPRLPVVGKSQLRAAGSNWISRDALGPLVGITTSGSTGAPLRFDIDRTYDQWRKAQCLRPYISNGRRLFARTLRLRPLARAPTKRPWFNRLGLLPELLIDAAADPGHVRQVWQSARPQILQGYPSRLRQLAIDCLQSGQALEPAPRLIFTDSELLLPETRELIERTFGAPLIDIFGTFETDNIAYQCERRSGYHVALDSVIIEIVRDGAPVAHGQTGELVVTVLRNRTMPFIRYNLRDLAAWATEPCGCGRTAPLLRVIAGRSDDTILLPDGRERTPQDVFVELAGRSRVLRQFQLRQTSALRMVLSIVPTAAFTASDRRDLADKLGRILQPLQLDIEITERIRADTSGKLRAFIREPFERAFINQ